MLKKVSYLIMVTIFIMVAIIAIKTEQRMRVSKSTDTQIVIDERFQSGRPDYHDARIENIFHDEIGY